MTIELLAEIEILKRKIEQYETAFDKITTELADYRDNPSLQKEDGWKNTFYDGIDYAIDVIKTVKEKQNE